MTESSENISDILPIGVSNGRTVRPASNTISSAIPFLGGYVSASTDSWSEEEKNKTQSFFDQWMKMMEAEMAEKAQAIIDIMARLDMNDKATAERVASPEYQTLVRKAFRDWAGAESKEKCKLITNTLAHAAYGTLTNDDVIRMFLRWIDVYSELHFRVISSIYNDAGVTRARIWEKVGKKEVREDSAEADLFKLLIRDLSTGSIIRQSRAKDYAGNFLRKPAIRQTKSMPASSTMESAFEDTKGYELTDLGQQFVHYSMTDIPKKIEFNWNPKEPAPASD